MIIVEVEGMEKKCNLSKEWKIQIEKDVYEIKYEGFYDERNHVLTINGEKRKIDIPVEIRSRKYDYNPYEYVFEIDGLELTIFLTEEYVFLVAQGIDVDSQSKYFPLQRAKKYIILNNAGGILVFILLFLGTLLEWKYSIIMSIIGVLLCIIFVVRKRFELIYGEKITWIKDDKGRIIQFKQDLDKIMGL